MIQGTFLPRLLFGNSKTLLTIVGTLSKIPVKKYGPGLLNQVTSTDEKDLSQKRARIELIQSATGEGAFSNADQLLALMEEMHDPQKNQEDVNDAKLKELAADLD